MKQVKITQAVTCKQTTCKQVATWRKPYYLMQQTMLALLLITGFWLAGCKKDASEADAPVVNNTNQNATAVSAADIQSVEKVVAALNLPTKVTPLLVKRIIRNYGSAEGWQAKILSNRKKFAEYKKHHALHRDGGANYQIRLVNENEGLDQTIQCSASTFILDCAEENGINLAQCDRSGASPSCACKVQGHANQYVDQANQSFLGDCEQELGFILPCAAFPTANMTLYTGQEEPLFNTVCITGTPPTGGGGYNGGGGATGGGTGGLGGIGGGNGSVEPAAATEALYLIDVITGQNQGDVLVPSNTTKVGHYTWVIARHRDDRYRIISDEAYTASALTNNGIKKINVTQWVHQGSQIVGSASILLAEAEWTEHSNVLMNVFNNNTSLPTGTAVVSGALQAYILSNKYVKLKYGEAKLLSETGQAKFY